MRQVTVAHAHCDLYCGVYDPAQAKIEAISVMKIAQKAQESDDEHFKARAVIPEGASGRRGQTPSDGSCGPISSRLNIANNSPNLDDLFWRAIHQAGDAKKSARIRPRGRS